MSTQTLNSPEAKSQSSLSGEQRNWLKTLGDLVGAAAQDSDETDKLAGAGNKQKIADIVAVPFAPALAQWGPEVLKVIQEIGGGHRTAAIEVVNHSDRVIHFGKSKFNGGGTFKKLPQRQIDPGKKDQFVATSPDPI